MTLSIEYQNNIYISLNGILFTVVRELNKNPYRNKMLEIKLLNKPGYVGISGKIGYATINLRTITRSKKVSEVTDIVLVFYG